MEFLNNGIYQRLSRECRAQSGRSSLPLHDIGHRREDHEGRCDCGARLEGKVEGELAVFDHQRGYEGLEEHIDEEFTVPLIDGKFDFD